MHETATANQTFRAPVTWSDRARMIAETMYARKNVPLVTQKVHEDGIPELLQRSVPSPGTAYGVEDSVEKIARRVIGGVLYQGLTDGLVSADKAVQLYNDLMIDLLSQRWAPNSPQFFNGGVWWAYGIEGPKAQLWRVDPQTRELIESKSLYRYPQLPACLPGDALVSTPSGPIRIEDIVKQNMIGLQVYDQLSTTKVLAVKESGEKEVVRVHLGSGNFIDATNDHRVLVAKEKHTRAEWKRVDELKDGDMLIQRLNTAVITNKSTEVDGAALAGWLQGDGFVGQYDGPNKSLTVEAMSINQEETDYISQLCNAVFGNHRFTERTKPTPNEVPITRRRYYGEFMRPFVEKYDLLNRGEAMRVPKPVLSGSKEAIRAYLQALFQADGCVKDNGHGVEFGTISLQLAEDVSALLLNLGIDHLYRVNRSIRGNRKPFGTIRISRWAARLKFAELIGFVSSDKEEKLLKGLEKPGKGGKKYRLVPVVGKTSRGVMPVYDIQTGSETFLTRNVVVHNCFLLDVEDSLTDEDGITDLLRTETAIFRSGSGAGVNFSKTRGKNEPLSMGGTSSGTMSFMTATDANAGAIKSGGTTRRAAKMVILDDDHPDLLEFISLKIREEQKVAALALGSKLLDDAEGMIDPDLQSRLREMRATLPDELKLPALNVDFTSEAYRTVDGQNANFSIRWQGDLRSKSDDTLKLTRRTDGAVVAEYPFAKIWHLAAAAAHASGDPGWHFARTVNAWHTSPSMGEIRTSNPCSEFLSHSWSACNLASVNVNAFLPRALHPEEFKLEAYRKTCRDVEHFLYLTVFASGYPHPKIARSAYNFRHTGIGPANLGTTLMRSGYAYDSNEGRVFAGALKSIMLAEAMKTTIAQKPSMEYLGKRENVLATQRVILMHAAAAGVDDSKRAEVEGNLGSPVIDHGLIPESFSQALYESWNEVLANPYPASSQHSVCAPTGTISLLMDCDTTGIEPAFAVVSKKKLITGETLTLAIGAVAETLDALGYTPDEITSISNDLAQPILPKASLLKPEHRAIFATATGAIQLTPEGHLDMLAALQPHTSGGLSKTINLPNEATVEDVECVATRAFLSGVKCIALYRDGSKLSQPLSAVRKKACPSCGEANVVQTGTCALCTSCGKSLGGCA